MTVLSIAIHALDFVAMWSLPVLFFQNKDKKLNVAWLVTALPFAIAPILLVLLDSGVLGKATLPGPMSVGLRTAGMIVALTSTALVVWAWRTHRVPLSLWHMENDAPANIVTSGPYAFIRHPFYTSFLLGMLGALLHAPHVGLAVTFIYAVAVLNWTAAREERRLAASAFGSEYAAYIKRTGRFLPGLG